MDLQNDAEFQGLDVALVSIALDSAQEQSAAIEEYGITVPMLIDADKQVSQTYDVLQWAVATGEPGHTFILIDEAGSIAWIRDYGAPPNGVMYVPVDDLTQQIRDALQ